MALDGTEVRVAGTGHVYIADAGTALPTSATTALASDWTDLGYVTEDGVKFTFGRETDDLNAWQGDKVRVLTLREPKNVELALMQMNADTLPVAFGGGTIVTATGTSTYTPPAAGVNTERALVVEFADGAIVYRYCFARVQIEGEVSFTLQKSGAVTLPINFGVLAATPPYTIVSNDTALDAA